MGEPGWLISRVISADSIFLFAVEGLKNTVFLAIEFFFFNIRRDMSWVFECWASLLNFLNDSNGEA